MMENYPNSIKFSQSVLNSIDDCLKYSNIFKKSNEKDSKYYNNDYFLSFLESDINHVQQIIDKKRRTYLGDDILVYVLDPGLVEPEYCCLDEKPEDPERLLLQQRRQRLEASLHARAEHQHTTEKSQAAARQRKLWRPFVPNKQEVLAAKGNEAFIEPLRREREELRRAKEEEEKNKIEWENREAQVEPYLNEVKEYGEPRHKIQSRFWINLLGADICEQNILVFEKSPKNSNSNNIKIIDEEIDTIYLDKLTHKENMRHEIRDFKHQEAEKKRRQKILAAMGDKERLCTQAAWQRQLERGQVEERHKRQWWPRKADPRKKMRKRFNEPPKKEPVKIIKQAPRELTDLEKKQLHAKQRHKYEMKQMQELKEKFYRPGKLNDISQLKVRKPKIPVPNDCEDKEFRLFATRFIARRRKELVQKFKWRNIVYPRPYTFGLGLKIFPGFTPAPEMVVKTMIQEQSLCSEQRLMLYCDKFLSLYVPLVVE